jgi:ABC-type antimicrobial peptide transport system permease subunit
MQDQLDPLLAPWRLGALAFTALGGVAAAVALLGLFSIMARLVAERRPDFAIRRALGAQTGQIVGPVLGRAIVVVVSGSLAGLLLTASSSRWIQPLLFHVTLLDGGVVAIVLAALLGAALLAAIGPARRAASADPMEALRAD